MILNCFVYLQTGPKTRPQPRSRTRASSSETRSSRFRGESDVPSREGETSSNSCAHRLKALFELKLSRLAECEACGGARAPVVTHDTALRPGVDPARTLSLGGIIEYEMQRTRQEQACERYICRCTTWLMRSS